MTRHPRIHDSHPLRRPGARPANNRPLEDKKFGSSAKSVGRNDGLEDRKELKAHPDPNSEKMELQHNHQLGGKERDATQDYPKSGSETRVVCLWSNTPDRERAVGIVTVRNRCTRVCNVVSTRIARSD